MNDPQLALIPAEPKQLTEKQEQALRFIRSTGQDGATSLEVGEAIGAHPLHRISNGRRVALALKEAGRVRLRKGGIWVALDAPDQADVLPSGMSDGIPF